MSEFVDPTWEEVFNTFCTPILNPSGHWRDYNETYKTYIYLVKLHKHGWFGNTPLPPAPDPADYPILD